MFHEELRGCFCSTFLLLLQFYMRDNNDDNVYDQKIVNKIHKRKCNDSPAQKNG